MFENRIIYIYVSPITKQRRRQRTHDLALKIQNLEVFSLTYGALVMQLLKDYEDVRR